MPSTHNCDEKEQRSKNAFRIKQTSKKISQEHIKLESKSTTVIVNEKLLPGDASMPLTEVSNIHRKSRMSLESIRLWFRLFIVNDLPTILFLFLWLVINIALFIGQFLNYHHSRSYFYLRSLISDGLSVARAAALCLNFNCLLILLPVCR
ncbi:unnamed protein product, partial [Rotaria sp. Silwood1]